MRIGDYAVINKAKELMSHFLVQGEVTYVEGYGNGHINTTLHVTVDDNGALREFILQKININVFKNPRRLMKNYVGVTSFLRKKARESGGDPDREALNVIMTKEDKSFYMTDDGECWRLILFVTDSVSYDMVENEEQFYDTGYAFGKFQRNLPDYPADSLYETIPNFHNTPDRLRLLKEAIEADACDRVREVEPEIAFALEREEFAKTLERAHAEGRLPLKVTHNDTKLNNILFDKKSGKPICVVDLDTIMPGYSVTDFGDAVRSGANTAAEDERDTSKTTFSLSLYETFTRGFIEGAGNGLTKGELELMPTGAVMMAYELGLRFLTDYLEGDTYFRTRRKGQNLDRARNQFKLAADMEAKMPEMIEIVNKYSQI
jgi:Ser/Thr protein kinase RdoA (MazF antagonist)